MSDIDDLGESMRNQIIKALARGGIFPSQRSTAELLLLSIEAYFAGTGVTPDAISAVHTVVREVAKGMQRRDSEQHEELS